MQLREVLGDAARDAPPVEVTALAYDNRLVTPARCSSAFPGSRATVTTSRPTRSRGARPRWSSSARWASASPRSSSTTSAPRWRPPPRALLRRPDGGAARRSAITGTNGKTTTAYLVRGAARGGRASRPGCSGTVNAVVGGARAPDACARRPRRSTCSARSPRCVDARRRARASMEVSSHALALHRADAIHWAVAHLHEPHPGPPRLPPDDGGLLPRQAAAVRGRRRGVARSSTSTTPTARGWPHELPRRRHASGSTRRRAGPRHATSQSDASGIDLRRRRRSSCARRCPGASTSSTRSARVAAARALGVDDATIAAALPRAGRVPGRFEPVDEGQAFAVLVDYAHTPDSLENVLRAARALTGGALTRARHRRVRRRRRPRPRQAPADGRGRRATSPTS